MLSERLMRGRPDVGAVLPEWDLGRVSGLRVLEKGVVNRNIEIACARGKFVLRQVPPYRTEKELRFDMAYLDYLRSKRFPYEVPAVIQTARGSLFARLHGRFYWLYRYIEGRTLGKLGLSHLRQAARMMTLYHSLMEKSGLDNGREHDLFHRERVLEEIRSYRSQILGSSRKDTASAIFMEESEKLIPILESLDEGSYSSLGRYPLHRDITPENLIWRDQRLVGLVDFENVSSYKEPFVKDIAVMFQHSFRTHGYRLDLEMTRHFLASYLRIRDLSSSELGLIPDLIVSGFIEDFAYAYWMMMNDPERARLRRLRLYSKAAQWNFGNRDSIIEALSSQTAKK